MLDCHAFEAIGQPLQRMLALRTFQQVIQSELPQSETLTITHAQGQERTVQVTLLPFRSDQGELMGALATLTDMTTTHRLEEEKRRLDRLASLGEMAANIAHEVRNPLASIKTSLQLLLDDLQQQPSLSLYSTTDLEDSGNEFVNEIHDTVNVALKEVERLHAIVHDLLQFSRPGRLHRVRCSLAEISDRLLHMLEKQSIEAGIFVHRLYHDSPLISVDITQIEQVLLNLFLNALQAMPDGGILTISLQTASDRLLDSNGPKRGWLELAVNDTGIGIASEKLERIFQPFFTTKSHGIGLGLPISRRLVEDHRGQLLVESQLGFGSTFILRLPLDEQGVSDREVDG
jgi:signal transduction histidine kinase